MIPGIRPTSRQTTAAYAKQGGRDGCGGLVGIGCRGPAVPVRFSRRCRRKFVNAYDVDKGHMFHSFRSSRIWIGTDSNIDSASQHNDLVGMVDVVVCSARDVDTQWCKRAVPNQLD